MPLDAVFALASMTKPMAAVGAGIGLFFGLVFAFGGRWADAEDGRK